MVAYLPDYRARSTAILTTSTFLERGTGVNLPYLPNEDKVDFNADRIPALMKFFVDPAISINIVFALRKEFSLNQIPR